MGGSGRLRRLVVGSQLFKKEATNSKLRGIREEWRQKETVGGGELEVFQCQDPSSPLHLNQSSGWPLCLSNVLTLSQ